MDRLNRLCSFLKTRTERQWIIYSLIALQIVCSGILIGHTCKTFPELGCLLGVTITLINMMLAAHIEDL